MIIGEYEVHSILTGYFRLDGGAMFGVVPRVLWEKTNPPDEKNRILMALRCLLIRGHGRSVLVDSGIGNKWEKKQIEMYGIDHSDHIDKALHEAGVTRADITDVILTHLHFDHVGGSTELNKEGVAELTFPKATYYIQKSNLNHAHAPTGKDRASFVENTIRPLLDSGRLKTMTGEYELIPGVWVLVHQGHTPGQQLVKVSYGRTTVLFCGDTIPTSSHIPIPYVMAFDLYPLTTMEEKRKILECAVAEDWILAWPHDPRIVAGKVALVDGKFRLAEGYSKI